MLKSKLITNKDLDLSIRAGRATEGALNGQGVLVFNDCCRALGIDYKHGNIFDAIHPDDRSECTISAPSSNGIVQRRTVRIINYTGFLKLCFSSRKPNARKVQLFVGKALEQIVKLVLSI